MLSFIPYLIVFLYSSIPFGYLISRRRGIDITKVGSKNIGAANVYRVLGLKFGILTFLLDFSKGALAFFLGIIFNKNPFYLELLSLISNIHSIFLRFRGGKGFANLLGFLFFYFFFNNKTLLIKFLLFYFIILILTGITSLSNILSLTFLLLCNLNQNLSLNFLAFLILIVYSHRENIVRLLKREERITIKLLK